MQRPIIVLISANEEWQAVKNNIKAENLEQSPFGEWFHLVLEGKDLIFFLGGWGKVSSAASTQYVIDQWKPSFLINLGTCGGFEGLISKGDIILVEETLVYDMVEQMTCASAAIDHYRTKIDLSWIKLPYPQSVRCACIVSGDRDLVPSDIPWLRNQFGAIAGDWETASIAWVARKNQIPCLILRGVSDVVTTQGSEAYGNIDAFTHGAQMVMDSLLGHLPGWLKKISQGFPEV